MILLRFLSLMLPLALLHAAPITLNLRDADIGVLIATVSEVTGKNFVVDPRVRGKVSVISAAPLEADALYEVFQSVLSVYGFAAIPGDQVIRIVPNAAAKQEPIALVDAPQQALGGDDELVTRIVQVQHAQAGALAALLRPLIPPTGHIAAYGPSNALVIADKAANVERLVGIIRRVDQSSQESTEIIPLRYAAAADVVRLLTTLEQGRRTAVGQAVEGGAPLLPQFVADDRTNSVLLSGAAADRLRLRTTVVHLDTPTVLTGGTQVIYLKFARAADLVPILMGVPKAPSTTGSSPTSALGGGDSTGAAPLSSGGGSGSGVLVQADEATNALVVTAPPDQLAVMRQVIAQLDIRRAQVLVEAVVAEVSTQKVAELGVQWVLDATRSGYGAGAVNFDVGSLSIGQIAQALLSEQIPSGAPASAALAVGSTQGATRFGALISALNSDADTNILSTPTLLTLDNAEAEIVVGQNVPFVTGSFTQGGGNSFENPFQTIERQDVGLKLKIRPQITDGNTVQLQIEQEVSNVVPSATALAQGPTTNVRTIKTRVLVEDGQVLILGGLVDDDFQQAEQNVPGLSQLPLLGNLFRGRRASRNQRQLMVFIHPTILRDGLDATARTNDKYQFLRERQGEARLRPDGLLPQADSPQLPPPEAVRERRSFMPLPTDWDAINRDRGGGR